MHRANVFHKIEKRKQLKLELRFYRKELNEILPEVEKLEKNLAEKHELLHVDFLKRKNVAEMLLTRVSEMDELKIKLWKEKVKAEESIRNLVNQNAMEIKDRKIYQSVKMKEFMEELEKNILKEEMEKSALLYQLNELKKSHIETMASLKAKHAEHLIELHLDLQRKARIARNDYTFKWNKFQSEQINSFEKEIGNLNKNQECLEHQLSSQQDATKQELWDMAKHQLELHSNDINIKQSMLADLRKKIDEIDDINRKKDSENHNLSLTLQTHVKDISVLKESLESLEELKSNMRTFKAKNLIIEQESNVLENEIAMIVLKINEIEKEKTSLTHAMSEAMARISDRRKLLESEIQEQIGSMISVVASSQHDSISKINNDVTVNS